MQEKQFREFLETYINGRYVKAQWQSITQTKNYTLVKKSSGVVRMGIAYSHLKQNKATATAVAFYFDLFDPIEVRQYCTFSCVDFCTPTVSFMSSYIIIRSFEYGFWFLSPCFVGLSSFRMAFCMTSVSLNTARVDSYRLAALL